MKKTILILFLFTVILISCGMSVYATVDTTQPLVVTEQLDSVTYNVTYYFDTQSYFMHIKSNEALKVGDTLKIIKSNSK